MSEIWIQLLHDPYFMCRRQSSLLKSSLTTLLLAVCSGTILASASANAQGLSPEQSLRTMRGADGFRIELVASEPLVKQPVAMEFDDRGRLWVIQYLQYPNPEGLKRVQVDLTKSPKSYRLPVKEELDRSCIQ